MFFFVFCFVCFIFCFCRNLVVDCGRLFFFGRGLRVIVCWFGWRSSFFGDVLCGGSDVGCVDGGCCGCRWCDGRGWRGGCRIWREGRSGMWWLG